MDYYEELGLSRSASVSEIRQAYKQLVRLLHPDHCPDETLRPLAELQMKRWNEILVVLTDPAGRSRYDGKALPPVGLEAAGSPPPHSWPQWLWPAVAAVVLAASISLFRAPKALPARISQVAKSPFPPVAAAVKPADPPKRVSRRASLPAGQPPEDGPEIGMPQESPLAVPQASAVRAFSDDAPVIQSRAATVAASPPAEVAPRPIGETLAGEWLFVPAAHSSTHGLYPPQYIELRITERSGFLHGRYRAAYRVPDQAISPNVSFEFEGPAGPEGATLPWSGAGGASGDVTLRLLTGGALEITWVANQLGSELGLISGTATLVRRLE